MNINNLYEAVPVEKEIPPIDERESNWMVLEWSIDVFVYTPDGKYTAFYDYRDKAWQSNGQMISGVTHWLRPVTRESIEAFLREQHKELKEECERLEKVAKFWQQKYYKLNPPYTPPKIDNL